MLRKTKNKIEKGSKSGAEDISKIQHPRWLLLSLSALRVMLNQKKRWKQSKRTQKRSTAWSCYRILSFSWPIFEFITFSKFWCFFHVSGSFQWIQINVFSCPGDPGTIPDWSWMDLGKVIFSWKFSIFCPTWVVKFSKNSQIYPNPGQSESSQI